MSKNSDASNLSRRKFLAAAGTVAAANSFVAGKAVLSADGTSQATPAPSSMSYLVTIKVDPNSTTNLFCYSAQDQNGNNVPMPGNSLTVNVGDTVEWTSSIKGGHKHLAKVRFTTTSPFSRNVFKWSENHRDGDKVQLTLFEEHYYCVGISDKDAGDVHADDPKIIVGGRGLKAKIDQAESELHVVKDKIGSVIELLEKAGKEAKKDGKDSSS